MQTNNELQVKASKDFTVPVEQLYEAWTNPEVLKQWWKPLNDTLTDVTNDVKEGGTVRYVVKENELTISGKYLEVKTDERLVYTWNWEFTQDTVKNASYQLTVLFISAETGSKIEVTQDNFESEEGTLPHQQGWNKGLEDLANYFNSSASAESSAGTQADKSGGYNESPEQVKVGGG